MLVPYVPNVTVINKDVLFSDIPLKVEENNLKVTSISNVEVEDGSLKKCIETIFIANPNAVFDTVQYIKEDKKVKFYTDKELSTKTWEEKILISKKTNWRYEIIEEVKKILETEKNKDKDCISLYDVARVMKKKYNEYYLMRSYYQVCLAKSMKDKYGDARVIINDFDYDKKEMLITFGCFDSYQNVYFAKNDEKIYITKTKSAKGKEILSTLENELSQLYDEFIKYRDFERQSIYGAKSSNTNFLVDICNFRVSIYAKEELNRYKNVFELSSYSNTNEYDYNCDSNMVIRAFKGKENEILKRIFIKISDCPKWSQSILYEIRQNELIEEQRQEEKQRYNERKKQKRLELKRKLFPFL